MNLEVALATNNVHHLFIANALEEGGQPFVNHDVGIKDRLATMRASPSWSKS